MDSTQEESRVYRLERVRRGKRVPTVHILDWDFLYQIAAEQYYDDMQEKLEEYISLWSAAVLVTSMPTNTF